jgi:hypothetical protein
VQTISVADRSTYTPEKLVRDINGIEPVPAYFLKPNSLSGKVPAVLYNHYHDGKCQMGKDEVLQPRKAIADLGYCALCMDTWCFGERPVDGSRIAMLGMPMAGTMA